MNFGEQLGTSIGGYLGARQGAKGYDKALDDWRDYEGKAKDLYRESDHWGRKGYRDKINQQLYGMVTDPSSFKESAGYQWMMDQTMQAASRQGAASGFGTGINSSGNVGIAMQNRAAGLASQEYYNMFNALKGISGASEGYGVAAQDRYGNMLTSAAQGKADAHTGRGLMQGQSQAILGHGIGQQGDNIAKSIMSSDARLKKNIRRVGKDGALNKYKWEWNEKAYEAFGLEGEQVGYLAQEVRKVMPEAVTSIKGYLAIDYGYLNELKEEAA